MSRARTLKPTAQDRAKLLAVLLVGPNQLESTLAQAFWAFDSDELLARILVDVYTQQGSLFWVEGLGYVPATLPAILRAVQEARAKWNVERSR